MGKKRPQRKKIKTLKNPEASFDNRMVQKNVLAFKVNIQRARQLCSPEYPAVLVGDAAVTPHPDTQALAMPRAPGARRS
jgi:hypothetical protein